MTREQAKELWPVIKAYGEGKTVQIDSDSTNGFEDLAVPDFNGISCKYRIKPEPKLRPWKPEEVPVGALIKVKDSSTVFARLMILYVCSCPDEACISTRASGSGYNGMNITMKDLLVTYLHSLNHGKTWLPCGVMEE